MEGRVRSQASGLSSPHEPERNARVHDNVLVCNICWAPPTDPVLTVCGHLFCWPCLYAWLHQAQSKTCPFCRIELREDISITPVYGSADPTGTSMASADHEGASMIPKRPAPPFQGSRLESLENLDDLGPDASRFVFRIVALDEVEAWKAECERIQTLLGIHEGRVHALERLLNRGDRRRECERDLQEERGSRSE